ncbi:protein CASC10 [Bos indicus x Bos taurus]|uniref:protein CASC10 n=1 Tax=Bos indicus x Bos taurus TaxID=30522 RepID=UPI000F7D54AF|nr:protein CASC10 [Bos indicus x Bos taurus]
MCVWEGSRREAGGDSGKPPAGGSGPPNLRAERGAGYLLGIRARGEPVLRLQERGAPARRRRISSAHDVKGSAAGLRLLGRGAGGPAPAVLPLRLRVGTPGGPALFSRPATSPHLSAHFPTPASALPPQPCPLAPLRDAFARVRDQLRAAVTVLKEIQSREPSGSRPADRRCGWRPRDVPTHSRDRGPGAARQAARRGEGGTTGQQRLLQVPGASAAAAQRRPLRWNGPRSPPALSAIPQSCFHPRRLPQEAGLAVQKGRSLMVPAAISLIP